VRKRAILVLVAAVSGLTACGGGGGGGGSPPGVVQALVGTYTLAGFTVFYDGGSVVTQDDVGSFSGTFVLNSNGTYSQSATADGVSNGDFGTWSANGASIFATSQQVACSAVLGYTFDGVTLTTTSDHQCGANFREIDRWTLIGPAPAAQALTLPGFDLPPGAAGSCVAGTLGQ
jgi:hypothetical protein